MLIGSDLPSFRDTQYPGIKHFLADMKAAGKDGDPVNLKVTGISTWATVQAVRLLAPNVKGADHEHDAPRGAAGAEEADQRRRLHQLAPRRQGPGGAPALEHHASLLRHVQERPGRVVGQEPASDRPVKSLGFVR